MGLVSGNEYNFFTLEENNHRYICIDCGSIDVELKKAMELLEKNGMKVVQS